METPLKIYHHIRKVIRAICHYPHTHLHNDSNIQALQLIQTPTIPPIPTHPLELNTWIDTLANIGKNAKIEAHKIIVKQTSKNCKTTKKKYRHFLNTKPKKIHKKIFNLTPNNSLNCLQNPQCHIITKPTNIAREI